MSFVIVFGARYRKARLMALPVWNRRSQTMSFCIGRNGTPTRRRHPVCLVHEVVMVTCVPPVVGASVNSLRIGRLCGASG